MCARSQAKVRDVNFSKLKRTNKSANVVCGCFNCHNITDKEKKSFWRGELGAHAPPPSSSISRGHPEWEHVSGFFSSSLSNRVSDGSTGKNRVKRTSTPPVFTMVEIIQISTVEKGARQFTPWRPSTPPFFDFLASLPFVYSFYFSSYIIYEWTLSGHLDNCITLTNRTRSLTCGGVSKVVQ
jgi:hypothetical protein